LISPENKRYVLRCVRNIAVASLLLGVSACTHASQPSGPSPPAQIDVMQCAYCTTGFCTKGGIARLLDDALVGHSEQFTERALDELRRLNQRAADTIWTEGLTCETLRKAEDNEKVMIDHMLSIRGATDPVPGEVDAVQRKESSLCPLWPFC